MKRQAFKAALPYSLPVCIGFFVIALSYGFLMRSRGFAVWYPIVMSACIFAGSMEFVTVELLLSPFAPVHAFLMALMVNARHLFYGISMLDRYKNTGWKKPYLIFGMCDETFSINCTAQIPDGIDRGWFYFFVTLLNHIYWFAGATLGGLLGSLIHFNTEGLEFVMASMFVVIFLEQWGREKRHISAYIGLAASVLCLLVFGADSFLIPTMICITAFLTFLRCPIERKELS